MSIKFKANLSFDNIRLGKECPVAFWARLLQLTMLSFAFCTEMAGISLHFVTIVTESC